MIFMPSEILLSAVMGKSYTPKEVSDIGFYYTETYSKQVLFMTNEELQKVIINWIQTKQIFTVTITYDHDRWGCPDYQCVVEGPINTINCNTKVIKNVEYSDINTVDEKDLTSIIILSGEWVFKQRIKEEQFREKPFSML